MRIRAWAKRNSINQRRRVPGSPRNPAQRRLAAGHVGHVHGSTCAWAATAAERLIGNERQRGYKAHVHFVSLKMSDSVSYLSYVPLIATAAMGLMTLLSVEAPRWRKTTGVALTVALEALRCG
jgi:hypothetical protein